MTFLLNYLPYIIIAIGTYLCYYWSKKHKGTDLVGKRIVQTVVVTLLLAWAVNAFTNNGYISTQTPERFPIPESTKNVEELEVQDRLRKPEMNSTESREHFTDMVDWKKHQNKSATTNTEQELPLPKKD